jgi:hypothetical protein
MALSDMLVQSALQDSTSVPDITGNIQKGAALGQQIEQTRMARAALEQKKQEAEQAKYSKVGDWFETASKMPDGPAKKAFVNKFVPNGIAALGLQDKIDPNVMQMLQGDPNIGSFLNEKARKGEIPMSILSSPEGIAKIAASPEFAQFGGQQALGTLNATVDEYRPKLEKSNEEYIKAQEEQKRAETAAAAQAIRGGAQQMNALRGVDEQAASAVERINNDTVLVNLTGQARSIRKGKALLNDAKHPPSWTTLNEVAQDYANALNPKGGGSDFKLKEMKTPLFDQKLGELASFLQSDPNQPANPEAIAFWKHFGDRLDTTYNSDIKQRAIMKSKEAETIYTNNKAAVKAAKDTAKSYVDGSWLAGQSSYDIHGTKMSADVAKKFLADHPGAKSGVDAETLKELGIK